MSLFITQCPHCHTAFKTSVSQLQSADGMVRCGACLRIFAADNNLLPSVDIRTISKPLANVPDDDDELASEQLALAELEQQPADSSGSPASSDDIFTLDMSASLPNRAAPSSGEGDPQWQFVEKDEAAPDTPEDKHTPLEPAQTHSGAVEAGLDTVDIADAPLELDWQESQPRSKQQRLILIGCIVLTLTIALQFTWFNREQLGQNPALRPYLDWACAILPCALSPLVDIRAIQSDKLIVQSHPEFSNALSVQLQFRNDAAFAQPLPGLSLTFSNNSNEVVARRRFTPEEYLREDLRSIDAMPAKTQLQVSLELLDPGPQALNYEISFYAVEQ